MTSLFKWACYSCVKIIIFPVDSSSHTLWWQDVSHIYYDIYKPLVRQQVWLTSLDIMNFRLAYGNTMISVGLYVFVNICYPNHIEYKHHKYSRGRGNFIRVNKVSLETILHHSKRKISMMVHIWNDNPVSTSAIIALDGWILFILTQSFGKW